MNWSMFWYVKAVLAWAVAAWGALGWGRGDNPLYLFVLSMAVALTAISVARVAKDAGRRQAYEAGWQARDSLGRTSAGVHNLHVRR